MRIFSSSKSIREYECRDLCRFHGDSTSVADRQKRVPGFIQKALAKLIVLVIGCGGLGGWLSLGLAKKGVYKAFLCDGDDAELSNLNRQFFFQKDIGKNKAVSLARNTSMVGFMGTKLVAIPYNFQAAVAKELVQPCDIVFCGVDNDETRVDTARHYLDKPVIYAAVSKDAGHGYVTVQEPGKACFGCINPDSLDPEEAVGRKEGACPVDPAVIDIVGMVAMLALYAIDSLIMDRPRNWNFKQVTMHGMLPEINAIVPRKEDCPICGTQKRSVR